MSRADYNFERDEWLARYSPKNYKIMVVEFNTGGTNYIPVRQASAQPTTAAATNDSSVSFDTTQSLQQSLKNSAQVRPEKVAQANALLSGGNYPSDAALGQLAGFFASRLQNS
jgi:hypothetical protein